jgi:hypothetical protein
MIPRTWRLKVLNWLGAGYMTIERDDDFNQCDLSVPSPSRAHIEVEGLSFNVMPAQGGTIIQLRKYDRKLDRNDNSTHVIPEGEDIAETIGKIVAMELWKV